MRSGRSSRRALRGWRLNLHHGQPIVEVGPQPRALGSGSDRRQGRGDEPHVGHLRLAAADALVGALLQKAQQLGLQRGREIANLVEKQRAAARRLDAALTPRHRSGERAALVAEELALEKRLRQPGQVHRHEGRPRTGRVRVNRPGDHLLARARRSGDEDLHVGGRRAADRLPHLAHGRAAADQVWVGGAGRGGAFAEADDERARAHGATDDVAQLRQIDRLGDVIEGAETHGADHPLAVVERGHHDDRNGVGPARAHLGQKIETVPVGQLQIEEDAVVLAAGERRARLRQAGRERRDLPAAAERAHQAVPDCRLVLDDEHPSGRGAGQRVLSHAAASARSASCSSRDCTRARRRGCARPPGRARGRGRSRWAWW